MFLYNYSYIDALSLMYTRVIIIIIMMLFTLIEYAFLPGVPFVLCPSIIGWIADRHSMW